MARQSAGNRVNRKWCDPSKDIQTYASMGNLNPNEPPKNVCPPHLGGNNYWLSSYSPRTRLLYIPALSNCVTITIGREKHNKERGSTGGLSNTAQERRVTRRLACRAGAPSLARRR